MLKAGIKRRRTQRQITDEKAEQALRQQAIDDKLARFEELQEKYNKAIKDAEQNQSCLLYTSDAADE